MPGIVRIIAIPPRTTPKTLRELLERHAPVLRLYLKPEQEFNSVARAQETGKGQFTKYVDGYVEFPTDNHARYVCQALNGRQMSAGLRRERKSRFTRFQWRLVHMPTMNWVDINQERVDLSRTREAIIRAEMEELTKHNAEYLEQLRCGKGRSRQLDGEDGWSEQQYKQRKLRVDEGSIDSLIGIL
ncbi:hypothetical protein GMRT_14470 [Giardia muris]|uniref:RRM domain-containing protein n=1 Tax=Giardia muris TaxID=5742 RepID=A0A4Z1SQW3_GIAMU|nr:hypothetical protein GMRT_14470 [Giardia muris]|eukprot:TNJ28262.1 hypothetical protein GMRT_14470 [Giardia muris]